MADWGQTTDIIKVLERADGSYIYPWTSLYESKMPFSVYTFYEIGNTIRVSNPLTDINWWLNNGYYAEDISGEAAFFNREPLHFAEVTNKSFVGAYILIDEYTREFKDLVINSFDYRGEPTTKNPKGIRSLSLTAYSFNQLLTEPAYSSGFNLVARYAIDDDQFYIAIGYRAALDPGGSSEFIFVDGDNPNEKEGIANTYVTDIREVPITYWDGDTIEYLKMVNAIDAVDSSDYDDSFGEWDNSSDEIDFPDLPWASAVASGFVKLYKPTVEILRNLANFLWSPTFTDALTSNWADPMEMIISLHILPAPVVTSGGANIGIGSIDSQIYAPVVASQYMTVDCGILNVKENFASALDYTNTKIQIYLPFVGITDIQSDECMDGRIEVRYHIDILSGGFVAFIKVYRKELKAILYHFSGNMAVQIPINATNRANIQRDIITQVAQIGVGAVTGGAGAAAEGLINTAIGQINNKPHISKSGSVSGSTGILDYMRPYLIITRPVQSLPKNFGNLHGYTSNVTSVLSALSGYTEVEEILSDGLSCHTDEADKIRNLLTSGVYL